MFLQEGFRDGLKSLSTMMADCFSSVLILITIQPDGRQNNK